MSNFEKILHSFSIKETLNPKVWENSEDPKRAKMIPKVRKALERIAAEFIDDLGEDVFVEDVYLMGSLANFNWSEYSDVDLHILVDFNDFNDSNKKDSTSMKKIVKEFFDSKKNNWNSEHDIKIKGYDVELYVQDSNEKHLSTGVYSILNNKWQK